MLPTLILLAAAAAGSSQAQVYQGDSCVLESAPAAPGTCRLLSQCARAIEELRERQKRPQHCSFVHNEPVVCCADLPAAEVHVQPAGGPTSPQQRAGAIAKKKCAEYTKYVFVEEDPYIMSWLAKPVNKSQCANPGDAFVTGGIEAKLKEFPHMAMIGYGDEGDIKYQCGGSLISTLYVLTAAHCTPRTRPARWVVLGELDRSTDQDGAKPERLKVSAIELHPQFIETTKYFDIALLRLEKEPVLSGHVRPACLHTEQAVPPGAAPIATGWGDLEFNGDGSDRLMKVRLPIQEHSLCNEKFDITAVLPRGILDDTQLCAGDLEGSRDTCQGDSGGPLQLFTHEAPLYCMHHIIGITSFGRQCGLFKNQPAVYTRVSSFVPWIEKIVWPDAI